MAAGIIDMQLRGNAGCLQRQSQDDRVFRSHAVVHRLSEKDGRRLVARLKLGTKLARVVDNEAPIDDDTEIRTA